MQIKLTPSEITEALIAHLRHKGLDVDTKPVSFVFYNRRTKGGMYAEATIGEEAVATTAVEVTALAAVAQETLPLPFDNATKEPDVVEPQEASPTPAVSLFG